MKDSTEDIKMTCDVKDKSKIKELLSKQVYKIKNGSYTCPICRETCNGLAAFGTHLKDHCR